MRKVKAVRGECYDITLADGEPPTRFEVESRWEGFMKLRSSKGVILAMGENEGPFDRIMKDFGRTKMGDEEELTIIKMSPSLLEMVNRDD